MAGQIVCALASSHGPLLSTPPDKWELRARFDRQNANHYFRGDVHSFDSLLQRRAPGFAAQASDEEKVARYDRTQRALVELTNRFRAARADVVIIFGNDQRELFHEELVPAFLVFTGTKIENVPFSEEARAKLEPGLSYAELGHVPSEGAVYDGAPDVAATIVETLVDHEFDVSTSMRLPFVGGKPHGIPHAFGFLYRRIMEDSPPPSVPIFTNIGCPPNIVRAGRCLAFGHAVKNAIDRLPDGMRVAVISSGGLSHFTIDEDFDNEIMAAMKTGDEMKLASFSEDYYWVNTCETKSWYPTVAMMNDVGRSIHFVDYVPCYRSPAGTGQAMAFAYWEWEFVTW
jgi:hypothetical protein